MSICRSRRTQRQSRRSNRTCRRFRAKMQAWRKISGIFAYLQRPAVLQPLGPLVFLLLIINGSCGTPPRDSPNCRKRRIPKARPLHRRAGFRNFGMRLHPSFSVCRGLRSSLASSQRRCCADEVRPIERRLQPILCVPLKLCGTIWGNVVSDIKKETNRTRSPGWRTPPRSATRASARKIRT